MGHPSVRAALLLLGAALLVAAPAEPHADAAATSLPIPGHAVRPAQTTAAAAGGHAARRSSLTPVPAATSAAVSPTRRRAVIAVVAGGTLAALAADRQIQALGLLDATVGGYNEQQALLDLTQGARASQAVYRPHDAPPLVVDRGGRVVEWAAARARAAAASAELTPGLLASSVLGGAAYAGAGGLPGAAAVIAADRHGSVAGLSLGTARSLAIRSTRLLDRFGLVVVDLPDRRALDRLLVRRSPGELVLVLERPPTTAPNVQLGARLLALGATGLPGGGGTLRSQTTRRPGLVTGIDVAPTILRWLGAPVPSGVQGQPLTRRGTRDAADLDRLKARLGVISGRRWPAIVTFLLGWLGLLLVGGRRHRAAGLRVGGLAALWLPCTVLAGAAVRPSRAVELAVIVGGAFVLALLNDRVLKWPRGPLAPAAAMAIAYTVDLGLGSPLNSSSLLGPNPLAGSRFFGVGNELEAALPVVLFAGLAAGRIRSAPIFLAAGLAFTAVIAAGRLGADVGAVFTIGGGAAAGALALRPNPSRRAIALACAVPVIGLVALAGLDLASGGGGHFTRTVLDAGSSHDLLDTIRRKLEAAFRQLRRGLMPAITAVCLLAVAYVVRNRARVLGPLAAERAWRACVIAIIAAGVVGSVFNDSGPVLLVIATFGLGCVIAYARGRPS